MGKIFSAMVMALLLGVMSACGNINRIGDDIRTIDHMVPHVSTVPANKGEQVQIFVREKFAGEAPGKPIVLMVHGASSPSTLAFDVEYSTYSWMAYLARAGFDVFAMDMTGYGRSARPKMDDPCNVDPGSQKTLIPKTLSAPCKPTYPFRLSSIQYEWDEIERVIEYILKVRGAAKVSLIGWSAGAHRIGTYTSRHPDKVERLVLYASANYSRKVSSDPPGALPQSGFPIAIQSREVVEQKRWNPFAKCDGQIEPGIQDLLWDLSKKSDPLGATWGPGVLRAPTRTNWGWNTDAAKRIKVPTLVMLGEFDDLNPSNKELYEDLGTDNKVFVSIPCGSHFLVWERNHSALHEASRQWLINGRFNGATRGEFRMKREQ